MILDWIVVLRENKPINQQTQLSAGLHTFSRNLYVNIVSEPTSAGRLYKEWRFLFWGSQQEVIMGTGPLLDVGPEAFYSWGANSIR